MLKLRCEDAKLLRPEQLMWFPLVYDNLRRPALLGCLYVVVFLVVGPQRRSLFTKMEAAGGVDRLSTSVKCMLATQRCAQQFVRLRAFKGTGTGTGLRKLGQSVTVWLLTLLAVTFVVCLLQNLGGCMTDRTIANCRSERLAKYNQLMRIEEELGSDATYAGENWRHIGW